MMDRRHADGCCVDPPRGSKTSLDGLEAGNAERLCGLGCSAGVGINHCDKLDRFSRMFEFAIDAKMVTPKSPCSDNDNAQWRRAGHYFFSVRLSTGASTT